MKIIDSHMGTAAACEQFIRIVLHSDIAELIITFLLSFPIPVSPSLSFIMARPASQWDILTFFTYHVPYVHKSSVAERPLEVWANSKDDGNKGDNVKLFCTPCLYK